MNNSHSSRPEAQLTPDRIRVLREEMDSPELAQVLALTTEQRTRFDAWSRDRLNELAAQFDVDTTESQKRVAWGMRIASTLGGLAICAALVFFFVRYWGFLESPVQVAILVSTPLVALSGAEFAARRERTLYFAGLLSLVTLASFFLDLAALGRIFNITSTERALLAWGLLALLLAYRYGLRPLLVLGLPLLLSYGAAAITARLGYYWLNFSDRPEVFLLMALAVFAAPLLFRHRRHTGFPAVYRVVGALAFFLTVLSLSEWGAHSYLPFEMKTVEGVYEFVGLLSSAVAIWLGITRRWNGVVNCGSIFFTIFLFCRLYHWWWEWMPRYLFFALIGSIAIVLVICFKQLRSRLGIAHFERMQPDGDVKA